MKLLVINGPNLNMLGIREEYIYGSMNYDEMIEFIQKRADDHGVDVEFYQSNLEGEIVSKLHDAYFNGVDGVIINPGAYSHYSIAIHDAIKAIRPIPVLEVHLSNIHAREEFRTQCITAKACAGQISGLGFVGYELALEWFLKDANPEDEQ